MLLRKTIKGRNVMKKISLISVVAVSICIVFLASTAQAECPEGKSEVLMTTPSGKQKVMCIPDAAVPGLENAADNSPGTIIPTTCPCWSVDDIYSASVKYKAFYCEIDIKALLGGYICWGYAEYDFEEVFSWQQYDTDSYVCHSYWGVPVKMGISSLEAKACFASMEPYLERTEK
jgi:hypothetical protein